MRKLIVLIAAAVLMSCSGKTAQQMKEDALPGTIEHPKLDLKKLPNITQPDWTKNAVIYEVNIRQHSVEGTFKKVTEDLPRIKSLGVDVIWLMPIQPIGVKNRKGSLGSYYSIKDYKGVNPEFGTLEDVKALVKKAHELKMKVILDWVANHTAWDNNWVKEDINRYTPDSLGHRPSVPKGTDWDDTADLDYTKPSTRAAMTDAMLYWLKTADFDGFRCDVAGMIPLDFWVSVRPKLEAVKPVFMLAEWGEPQMHKAFNMTYAWDFLHVMNAIAKGEKKPAEVENYLHKRDSLFKKQDLLMYFITNHDENSWNKTEFQRYGKNVKNFATLAYTLDGMPLLYSGQEVGNTKELKFFEKDSIDWKGDKNNLQGFYKQLINVYKTQPALWTGKDKAPVQFIKTDNQYVLIYRRVPKTGKTVNVIINFGGNSYTIPQEVLLQINPSYATNPITTDLMGQILSSNNQYIVPPNEMRIF